MAALLLLFSMFAFALVFHAVTRPSDTIAGQFNTQVAPLARPVEPRVRTTAAPRARNAIRLPAVRTEMALPITAVAPLDVEPAIDATPAPLDMADLPASIEAAPPALSAVPAGAVTRGLAATRGALRSAIRKAF